MAISGILSVVIVAVSLTVGLVSRHFLKKPDNPIEEIAEEFIRKESGVDIDLSPDSPETEDSK